MSILRRCFEKINLDWQHFLRQKYFRYRLFAGTFFITLILISYPIFFQYIEKRKGLVLNDVFLNLLPAINVYIPIFFLVWSNAVGMMISAIKKPQVFITFLFSYILLAIVRALTILLFPFEAPSEIIALIDPLSNYFYGVTFITKDLFFSGHVSTLFLIYLCQNNKYMKYYAFISCICVSILVLLQHIHYTIDVIFAFPFAYLCYSAAVRK